MLHISYSLFHHPLLVFTIVSYKVVYTYALTWFVSFELYSLVPLLQM